MNEEKYGEEESMKNFFMKHSLLGRLQQFEKDFAQSQVGQHFLTQDLSLGLEKEYV